MLHQYDQLEDEMLWLKIREGDRIALEALYKRSFAPLYRYGCKIFHNPRLVEDGIHDLFLDLWRLREKLYATTSVRFYLLASLKRRIIHNQESHQHSSAFDLLQVQTLREEGYSPEEVLIENERRDQRTRRLNKYLQALPPRQYEALLLKFYNELSYAEIGAALDINEQSARNLVGRGLELLRKHSQILISLLWMCSLL